jgi:hypothetical protein
VPVNGYLWVANPCYAPCPGARTEKSEGTDMKNTTFAFGSMAEGREDGAPVDYARYRAEIRDQLDATDIMLALVLDKDDEQQGSQHGFDPYNSSTP